ncbi:alpha/beta fold hydrolase [Streptomyces sp. NPDC026589]|uniref:thioesterase II family protein n=1 Tax=Streptomyces sp. NPDC026589 TaxID=3155609 RepID=UPI0033F781B7
MTARPAQPRPATPPPGYLVRPPDPEAPLRLFCFHHAGGTASIYNGWDRALAPGISVVPVQLPGRERRVREPRVVDLGTLVTQLQHHLGPHLDAPYALYGHSMGALVAYALTRARHAAGQRLPDRLLVGAYPAPHRQPVLTGTRDMTEEQLSELLVDIGGMSPLLLQYPEWRTAALELIRDDLQICHRHRHTTAPPLPCPVDALTGTEDPLLTRAQAAEWADHAGGEFAVHGIPGGHLFLRDSAAAVHTLLRGLLTADARS